MKLSPFLCETAGGEFLQEILDFLQQRSSLCTYPFLTALKQPDSQRNKRNSKNNQKNLEGNEAQAQYCAAEQRKNNRKLVFSSWAAHYLISLSSDILFYSGE